MKLFGENMNKWLQHCRQLSGELFWQNNSRLNFGMKRWSLNKRKRCVCFVVHRAEFRSFSSHEVLPQVPDIVEVLLAT